MKTITANGVELMLVEVPEGAKKFGVFKTKNFKKDSTELDDNSYCTLMNLVDSFGNNIYNVKLEKESKSEFDILGTITNGVVDFDVEGLVLNPTKNHFKGYWWDYVRNVWTVESMVTKEKSFLSLLAANGILTKNPHGETADDAIDMSESKQSDDGSWRGIINEWHEAEKNIWNKIVVLKISKA